MNEMRHIGILRPIMQELEKKEPIKFKLEWNRPFYYSIDTYCSICHCAYISNIFHMEICEGEFCSYINITKNGDSCYQLYFNSKHSDNICENSFDETTRKIKQIAKYSYEEMQSHQFDDKIKKRLEFYLKKINNNHQIF